MNRLNRYLRGALAALLAAAAPALCADLLVDDFTDAAASHGKWVSADETLNTSVSGGSCTLDNSASPYIGEYKHVFSSKPAVFTLTYVLKSVTGSSIAGAFFCRQPDSRSGYILTVDGNIAVVFKLTQSGNNIDASPIFQKESFDLNPANNKLTVSKSGSTFNIFANDAFVGSFTDAAPYNAGDISLVAFGGTKAVFGTVQVTDVFTEGSSRTSFSDNFNGNGLKYWQTLKNGSPTATEAGGVLTVRTAASDAAWMYVDFEHPNFTAKVETSHRSGLKSSVYGLVLVGEALAGQPIPMTQFAITGNREYAIWSGTNINPESNPAILGAASGGLFFVDTLEIKKSANSPAFEFFANNTLLATFPLPNGFKAIGVGIFCYGDLEVAFDNFSVTKEGSPSSIINRGSKQISRNQPSVITRDHTFYDMRGRKRYTITPAQGRVQARSAGIYVNKNGRDVAVKRGRAVNE
ncbi:hypothetical protein R80B4_01553 [Fibrobacteres bacterium R8-0-B4]